MPRPIAQFTYLALCALILIAVALPAPIWAQAREEAGAETLTITGQIRHRSEIDYRADPAGPAMHLLRTRLNASFRPTADVHAFVQVQDARMFGSENPASGQGTLDGRAPALDLHQAYFAVTAFFGTPIGIRVGRQELSFGNQRLIGSVDWSNVGRSFDAGVASFWSEAVQVEAFAARLVDDRTEGASQNLFGVYGTWRTGGPGVDVFALIDNNTARVASGPAAGSRALQRQTAGTRLHGTQAAVDYDLEYAYQFGRQANADAARDVVRAYLASASAGVRFGRARVGGLYTILSGDADPDDGRATTFNTLFATNHKFYGYLDLFPFNPAFRAGGLHDAAVQAAIDVVDGVRLALDLHQFALDRTGGTDGRLLGREIDLTASYRYNTHFGVTAGGSVFVASNRAEAVLGKSVLSWIYVSSNVRF